MKIRFAFLFCCLATAAFAQQQNKPNTKVKFGSFTFAGALLGQSENAVQVQTINGVRWQQWFAGIGAGLDTYLERTVPVFIDLRKELLNRRSTPFIYANGGYHFLWLKNKSIFESDQESGWYYEAGFGYSLPLGRRISLLASGGYSYKPFSKTVNTMPWISAWPAPQNALQHYDYQLRRVSVKFGISF